MGKIIIEPEVVAILGISAAKIARMTVRQFAQAAIAAGLRPRVEVDQSNSSDAPLTICVERSQDQVA